MGFLDWLSSLGGGASKPAAPSSSSSDGIPEMLRRPVEQGGAPAPKPSFFQNAVRQTSAPPSPFAGVQAAPVPGNFPAFMAAAPQVGAQGAQEPQNTGPWRTLNFAPPPPLKEPPLNLQAPQPDGFLVTSGQKQAAQQVEDKKAAEQRSAYFGDEGQYAKKQLSIDEYLTLSPRQRAVVDANTALIAAAEQDTASWAKQNVAGKTIDDKDYLNQVKQTFGDAGGSDTYAPRTMAVLKDLGLDLKGRDLDQYLNYSGLVTADDLKALPSVQPGAAVEDPRLQNAVAFSQAATTRLSETLAMGQTLLDSIRSAPNGKELAGPAPAAPVGFSDGSARDTDLKQAFDVFAQKRSQADLTPDRLAKVYAELEKNHGVTPNEVAQYFETRLQAKEYEGAAANQQGSLKPAGVSFDYLTPEEFRSKFLKRGE